MMHWAWEYHTERADPLSDQRLNALGDDGWELVTIHDGRAVFKRPGPDFRERITAAQRAALHTQAQERPDEA